MYELKKNWRGTAERIYLDRALVLWKKNLPGGGLTKVEKHWCRVRPQTDIYLELHPGRCKETTTYRDRKKSMKYWKRNLNCGSDECTEDGAYQYKHFLCSGLHTWQSVRINTICYWHLIRTVYVTVSTKKHYLLLTFNPDCIRDSKYE